MMGHEQGQLYFSLSNRIEKNKSVYEELIGEQRVAVKVIHMSQSDDFLRTLLDTEKHLLKIRNVNLVRYLDHSADYKLDVRYLVMELCLGSLSACLNGQIPDTQLETSDILWQVSGGLDHLRWYRKTLQDSSFASKIRASLDPCKILVSQIKDKVTFKLQVILKGPFVTKRDADEMPDLGKLARSLSVGVSNRCDQPLRRFIQLMEHPDRSKRPESFDLVLCHPYFILSRAEARQRIANLLKSKAKIYPLLFNSHELKRWYQSADVELRKELESEDLDAVQQLMNQNAEVKLFGRLLEEGLQLAPHLTSNFLFNAMVAISFARNCCYSRPLHLAAQDNANAGLVRLLLETGADLEAKDKHCQTALHLAAGHNINVEIVRILLDKGANFRAVNIDGNTALHLAAGHNANADVAALLVDRGADWRATNRAGRNPLHLAASFNPNPEVLRLLVQKTGMDIKSTDSDGAFLLYLAASFNTNAQVCKLLLVRGVNPNASNGLPVPTLLLLASSSYPPPNPDALNILLEFGANVRSVDQNGRTALHLAAQYNQSSEIIRIFLKHGANRRAVDHQGKTALQLAVESRCNQDVLDLLQ